MKLIQPTPPCKRYTITLFIPSLRMTEALSVAKYPGYQATNLGLDAAAAGWTGEDDP